MNRQSKEKPAPAALLGEALERKAQGRPSWEWFDHRVRTHGEAFGIGSGQPVPPMRAEGELDRALELPRSDVQRTLYLHVPFCQRICAF